jgi:hypothetical protein
MRYSAALVLMLLCVVGGSVSAFGETVGPNSAIQNLPGKATDKQMADFKSNPQTLLKGNAIGGLQMSSEVKGLVLADPAAAVDAVLVQAKAANSAQAAAIGTGLGQAVKLIAAVDKALGDDLARKIAAAGSAELLAGYTLGTSDIQTLAVGPGVGAAIGGGLGGPVGGVVGTSVGSTARTSAPGSFNFANSAATFNFAGASVLCSTSVSPKKTC